MADNNTPRKLTTEEAVQMLDSLHPPTDYEKAHGQADEILLSSVPAPVRRAYERLRDSATNWPTA